MVSEKKLNSELNRKIPKKRNSDGNYNPLLVLSYFTS